MAFKKIWKFLRPNYQGKIEKNYFLQIVSIKYTYYSKLDDDSNAKKLNYFNHYIWDWYK